MHAGASVYSKCSSVINFIRVVNCLWKNKLRLFLSSPYKILGGFYY